MPITLNIRVYIIKYINKNQDRMFMDELNNLKKIELKNNISVIDDDIQEEKSVFRELIQRL